MKKTGLGIGAFLLVGVAALIVATNIGLIGVQWPWEKIDIPEVLTDETTVTMPEEAVVYAIEPIALDCRARIRATVPVEGKREHKALGQVYRTDTVTMVATGDIDTCVDASAATVSELADGTFTVVVPAESVTFERPRVDAEATRDSVRFDKGFVGKLTDALPWVSDNSGLTPAAYAYAQGVVGSSECMQQAWRVTETVLRNAYRDQMSAQGGEPGAVSVIVTGVPDFGGAPDGTIDDFAFEVDHTGVKCALDTAAFGTGQVTTERSS